MSLFESDEYQWRETYFIFFSADKRPRADKLERVLRSMNARYLLRDLRTDENRDFESVTVLSPDDYAAMDITCTVGDEVTEQALEMATELKTTATKDQIDLVARIPKCSGRIEVYHFEQLVFVGSEADDEFDDFMDPGALLVVLQQIADLCDGIVVDPQSGSLL